MKHKKFLFKKIPDKTIEHSYYFDYFSTPKCSKTPSGFHFVSHIELRGKQDSYTIICSCGLRQCMALWYDNLPAWKFDAKKIHQAFELLRDNFVEYELSEFYEDYDQNCENYD